MYRLEKQFRFEASHVLPDHDGKCARLHGHSWKAVVCFEGQRLQSIGPKRGMLVDFADVKAVVQPIVDTFLDHYHLNESTGIENPTSEALAEWLFKRVENTMSVPEVGGPRLAWVRIEETCTSACTFYRP